MAVLETKIFKQEDLVLKVTDSYDPFKLPVVDWEEFLDALCNNRKYQNILMCAFDKSHPLRG